MSTRFPATTMPDRDWWAVLWPDPEIVLRQLGIHSDMIVLDLCCGDGYFTAPLAKHVDGKVFALDLDPEMLEQAKMEVARQGTAVRQWICADAREISELLPEPVDYVLMANTFHGVPDQFGLSRAVRMALRRQGLFGVVNWLPLPREETTVLGQPRGPQTEMRMSSDSVRAIIEPSGYRMVRIVNLPPYHYGAVFEAVP
ncbi:class I SAM-dependent methyltransferase [Manganibacter manganicus]|uniref:Methyltransferase n=1 Tax=Manganibacter manganicus TaxID=1873176 RepID=A0A1V8RR51_9HYPH|nr:class I SAM-dependent methyltransferase [Pseudaminobacter manganicus]OQM75628.1 methyltransferase [Pseudaminobacter manganicus]